MLRLYLHKYCPIHVKDDDSKEFEEGLIIDTIYNEKTKVEYLRVMYGPNNRDGFFSRFSSKIKPINGFKEIYLQDNPRIKLTKYSHVKVWSRSKQTWCPGYVNAINIDQNNQEWLTIKYQHKKYKYKKKMQRFCQDLQTNDAVFFDYH